MLKIILFVYCFFISVISYANILNEGDFQIFELYSNKSIIYLTQNINIPQIIVIRNFEIDTFSEITLNELQKSYASWMGQHGFYYIYIPADTKQSILKINSLDSKNQVSKVGVKSITLQNYNSETINAFKKHSFATYLRYLQYTGGKDQRTQALSSYLFSKRIFDKNNLNLFAAISSYEAAYIQFELNQMNNSIKELESSYKLWNSNSYNLQKNITLSVKGLALWRAHKLEESLEIFNKLLIDNRQSQNPSLLFQTYNNIGLIYWEQGEFIKSKLTYIKALEYLGINLGIVDNLSIDIKNVKNLKAVSATINNLALVYDSLGNTNHAINLWESYIELSKSLSDSNILAQAKNNISLLYLQNGKFDKAKTLLNEAIITFKNNNNNRWLSLANHNLGQVYFKLGLYRLAEIQFKSALLLRDEINNPKGLLESKIKLMELYRKQFKYHESKKISIDILKMAKKINYPKAIALSYLNDFHIHKFNKKYDQAENDINNAIKIAESKTYKRIVSKLSVNKAKLYFSQNKYKLAIGILELEIKNLKNIWDTKLLNTANNLLAQAYININNLTKAETTINDEIDNLQFYISSTKSDKIRSYLGRMLKETLGIYNTITALQNKPELGFVKTNQMLTNFRSFKKKDKSLESALSQDSVDNLLTMINSKSLALENSNLSLDDKKQIHNDIIELKAQLDFSYEASTHKKNIGIDIKTIQSKLNNDSIIIQFSISESSGVSWWLSKDTFEFFNLVDKNTISQLVKSSRNTLLQKNNDYENIISLSRELLAPLKNYNRTRNILLLLDEPLNLLPFNALHDPRSDYKTPIANTVSIKRLSSINSFIVSGNQNKTNRAIIIADPVTSQDDNRLNGLKTSSNTQAFTRLIGTKFEAKKISQFIEARVLQGFDASKFNFLNTDLNDIDILHFATHAFFHSEIPGLSSLVLSSFTKQGDTQQSSFLRALEISNMHLDGKLIVLSGCETGIGKQDNSLGLDGLTQAFMQAGAKNLIASLWKVDDRITKKMMTEFYRNYSVGMSITKALWNAQKIIRDNPRTRHPKYWAGWFLLTN